MRMLRTTRIPVPQMLAEEEFGVLRFGNIAELWAAGPRSMFVRLPCVQLTSRRVIPDGR